MLSKNSWEASTESLWTERDMFNFNVAWQDKKQNNLIPVCDYSLQYTVVH